VADLREALDSFMSRLSEGQQADRESGPEEADWFCLDRSEVRFSQKPGPRPYLRLAAADDGVTTLYPRTTLKGEAPTGKHIPDQQYPRGVWHKAHVHERRSCCLDADATVLACAPRPVGAYLFRGRTRDCVERDAPWLRYFRRALAALADEGGAGDA
jgi:hypothetical protein